MDFWLSILISRGHETIIAHDCRSFDRIAFVILLLAASARARSAAGAQSADTIVHHAKIYTVNAKQPWAEALAIQGDKIVAVGSEADVEKLRKPRRK